MTYDVIIVGGGPAGLFAAYHLVEHAGLKVLLIERGERPQKRKCPISKVQKCAQCDPCNILSGIGGAGLYSDGKLNFIPRLGKTDLTQFMPMPQAQALINETEEIFTRFKMDAKVFPTNMDEASIIRKEAKRFGINLLLIRQKHLGSDNLPGYITEMADYIESKGLEIRTGENVTDIIEKDGVIQGVVADKRDYHARNVILAPGRIGANWMSSLA
ncbi:FAD-dependent oxidoreductase, partial [Desulfobacter postgatei]